MFENLQQNLNEHITAGVLGVKKVSAAGAADDIIHDAGKVESAKLLNQDAMKALAGLGAPKTDATSANTLGETARDLDP